MADLKISALNSLAGADLVAADVVAVVDDSASETKKLTVSDLIANGSTLISDNTIPSAKILFSAGAIDTAELAASAVETAKINDSAVTAAKLADNSSVTLVSTLPASGDFVGQIALDTDDNSIVVWNGSAWLSPLASGSINVINGSTTGEVNIVATTSGSTVTISATLDNTTAAAQFLGGPTGAGGTVGYRALVGTDLPTATTSAKGGVIVNGEGLRMDSDTIEIDNDVTANSSTYQAVQFDSKGLITAGRDITAADLPNATSGAVGAVKPGSGLSMGSAGAINHTNAVTGATNTKITFDAQGHVTAGANLAASDVPDLDAAKITTGTFPTARIADDAVTAAKLGDRSTATIAETTPAGGAFIGQTHLNSITGDYFLWDGNVWQPIGISVGEIILAGTYNASTNKMATVTSEGTALSFVVGSALPAASSSNKGYYVVVSTAGTGTSPAPTVALNPPDFLLSTGTAYTEIDVSATVTAQQASNVAFTAAGNIAATNVQAAIEELDTEKVGAASPTFTGTVALGEDAVLTFEGATDNAFETTLTVTDPTADRTITLPNVTGTVVTTGDTGSVTSTMIADGAIVNADINASAEIAVSKLANGSARQLLQTASNGTDVEFTSNVDVPGTLDCTGAGTFDSTLTVTGLISADGKVSFPAGTAAAPSFYFGTDTNTGLYHSAADEVAITTGGTQRVVVDNSGNVGIGNNNPGHKLDVTATGNDIAQFVGANSAGLVIRNATSNVLMLHTGGTDHFAFGTNGSNERLRIDSSGNVGIGTSSPTANLHGSVSSGNFSTIFESTATSGESSLVIGGKNSGGTVRKLSLKYDNADLFRIGTAQAVPIRFETNDTEQMRILSNGHVVIGDTSDTGFFRVSAADGASADQYVGQFENLEATAGQSYGVNIRAGSNSTDHGLRVKNRANDTTHFLVRGDGNVGIGTTTVSDKLHVSGVIRAARSTDAAQYGTISVETGNVVIDAQGNVETTFRNNGSEKVRIDQSGRLLVGTTSVSESSLKLEIAGTAGTNYLGLTNTTASDTDGSRFSRILFRGTQSGSEVSSLAAINASHDGTADDQKGRISFRTNDGNDGASPTERLRIASDGVVTVKNGAVAEIDTLTSASTVTPDFAASCNFTLTLGTNVTLANPSNVTAGQSGSIFLVQDGTGSRTLTLGSNYDFAGGTAPTLSTAANAVDRLDYIVRTSTSIHCVVTLAYS